MNLRDRQILQIAFPSIVSNITVPLLGMVDVAIVGHMGKASYIGAVSVGSMIFNLVYWLFGFLRMGTSGTISQAYGRRNLAELMNLLVCSIAISAVIALLLIILQTPIRWFMLWIISPSSDVTPLAITYYNIVVWGAPATLGLYSLTGWFIGMQNTRIPMAISIIQNVINILASFILVYSIGMKIEGIALGTLIAQYCGFIVGIVLLLHYYRRLLKVKYLNGISFFKEQILRLFQVNRDIFLRTLCLVTVNLFFTSAGARSGTVILSVNTVMIQFYLFFSYIMDGFAYAGEALCGRLYGALNIKGFYSTLHSLFRWAALITILFTIVYILGSMPMVQLLTNEPRVIASAHLFIFWIWLLPMAGSLAFIWDGIFIGITATRGMLISSFLSSILFFIVFFLLFPYIGNHALWLAQITFLLSRGIIQSYWFKNHFCFPPTGSSK